MGDNWIDWLEYNSIKVIIEWFAIAREQVHECIV